MRTWKLVSGILCMVIFIMVMFQSCVAGLSNAFEGNGELSGTAGVFVAIMMLTGGIVSVANRNAKGKGGNVALIILFGLAAFVGFVGYGSFTDLAIWAGWCLINAIVAFVCLKSKDSKKE